MPGKSSVVRRGRVHRASLSRFIYPEDFGAKGDGVADDATALQAALDAITPNVTLSIRPTRVYNHSQSLEWTTTGAIVGADFGLAGGRLHGTVETDSAFKILGAGQRLEKVDFSSANTGRGTTWEEMKVLLYFCTGAHLVGTRVLSSRCAAFFCESAAYCTLDDIVVLGSRADGLHMTGASHDMLANRPSITSSGDDGIAVVSYAPSNAAPPGFPCYNIVVNDPVIRSTLARGMSVVGGRAVRYNNVDIDGCTAAGLYISAEATPATGFNTESVSDVQVTVKQIANANSNAALDHGDIFFYCGINRSISTVVVDGLTPASATGGINSSDTSSAFHIGGRSEDATGSVATAVKNLRIVPNDAKPLKFEGTNTTITLTNVSY